jgi:lambda repressor-like predicted transcriptional regulator
VNNYPHHEAADKYPMIEGEAFAAFKADIQAKGQRLPIYIQNGLVVDGRNRQKACAELGIEPVYEEIEGDPFELAESLNEHRRHLTKDQRNDLIMKKRSEGKSTRQIAEEVGVSNVTVKNVIDSTVKNLTVDQPTEVIGKDGKKRKAKTSKVNPYKDEVIDGKVTELAKQGLGEAAIAREAGLTRFQARNRLANIAKEKLKEEADALPAKCEEVKQELSLTAQQKLDKAIALFEQAKLVEMQKDFQTELQAAIGREQDKINAARKELIELEKKISKAATTITTIITYDEFKMIRGCLHPDRQPEELKDKFGKAFELFNRLEQHVNIKAPIDFLRRYGWEQKSPFYKGKKS